MQREKAAWGKSEVREVGATAGSEVKEMRKGCQEEPERQSLAIL